MGQKDLKTLESGRKQKQTDLSIQDRSNSFNVVPHRLASLWSAPHHLSWSGSKSHWMGSTCADGWRSAAEWFNWKGRCLTVSTASPHGPESLKVQAARSVHNKPLQSKWLFIALSMSDCPWTLTIELHEEQHERASCPWKIHFPPSYWGGGGNAIVPPTQKALVLQSCESWLHYMIAAIGMESPCVLTQYLCFSSAL